jgi:formamidopyrimidine-DNA glycosylase
MPELPEVEEARRLATRVARGRRIVRVRSADDPIVFEGVAPARIRRALLGRRVRAVRRHGKHFWFELDARPWLVIHFGMTGGLHSPGGRAVRLVSDGRRPRVLWPPRFIKLRLGFDDGGELVVADARRLGRIRLRWDPPHEPPVSLLGFDALHGLPTPRQFLEMLRGRSAPVKALLLDQAFAAGVGNWIADEVLYQARIDPRRRTDRLTRAEALRLRGKIRLVIATAVAGRSDGDRFPRAWLFHHRWGRNAEAVMPGGHRIRHATIGGRTTAWVPAIQR